MRDRLSTQPITFRVWTNTLLTHDRQPASQADLKPGALIAVKLAPYRANSGTAREIAIAAMPGSQFNFTGRVTSIDLHSGILSVENQRDSKTPAR